MLAAASGSTITNMILAACAVIGALLSLQQWARARRAEKAKEAAEAARHRASAADEKRRELQQEISEMVRANLKALLGTDKLEEITDPGPDNPSIKDSLSQALEETAALTSSVAFIIHAFELHLAEPHGGVVPEWVLRAATAQQKAAQRAGRG